MRHRLARDDLLRNGHGVVARNREPYARKVPAGRLKQGVDTHQLTLVVHKSPTGVSLVDCRINLDQVGIDGIARARRQHGGAIQCAHDARGH